MERGNGSKNITARAGSGIPDRQNPAAVLIVAPPKSGKTTLLQHVAHAIATTTRTSC